jgi:hypothetical protein
MSFKNPLPLSKTSLDVEITYNNSTLKQPVQLNIGNAINGIIDCTVPKNVLVEKTATGDTSYALTAVIVSGKIHLHPASPGISALSAANKSVVPGTIEVTFPTAGISYTYPNVFITSPFKGHDANKEIEDYAYDFDCDIPDQTSLSGLSTLGLVNIV